MKSFTLISVFCLLFGPLVSAQWDEIKFEDEVYVDYIKSVQFHITGIQNSFPISTVNRVRPNLTLRFDDMGGEIYDYSYEIIHCTKDWQKSDIREIDYLRGFNREPIRNFNIAQNTIVPYTQYFLGLPNEECGWLISGNYLLVIYDEEDLPIITRRFIVKDPKVIINGSVEKSNSVKDLYSEQTLEFDIQYNGYTIDDPRNEISVSILQNGRNDHVLHDLKPTAFFNETMEFKNFQRLGFPAQKEFRNFDIRSLYHTTEFVHSIDLFEDKTEVLLELEESRAFRNYIDDPDLNGQFYVANENPSSITASEDYVDVFFTLENPYIEDKDVYLIGKFSDWKIRDEYKMSFDESYNSYLNKVTFKQGIYDYLYAVVDQEGTIDTEYLEGNWYETENDYLVVVYQRPFGIEYDMVIGTVIINSLETR